MASPISVPGNNPNNNAIAVNGANMGRRGSQSLSSFGPFSPPGATSVAAAAALGSSPPTATSMNMSASTTGSGYGAGFLGGSGLARSISNGKQMGQTPLMSPTVASDKGARGQGILRRLSLGAGGARPNLGKSPAAVSPSNMPLAADSSLDHSQTDITSSTSYFSALPPSQPASGQSSAVAAGSMGKSSGATSSFYANPFSGAILHEAHDEHEHDLVPGMSAINLGNRVPDKSHGVEQGDVQGMPRSAVEAPRARKISFGWSGFMSGGKKDTGSDAGPVPLSASSEDPPRPRISEPDTRPPVSILVRRESGPAPASPPVGGGTSMTTLSPQDKFKFGHGAGGDTDKSPVSVTVQQVSLAPSVSSPRNDTDSSALTTSYPREATTSAAARPTQGSPTTVPKGSAGMLGGSGVRGRRGSEAGAGGGKKRSVSPMAEHILRGGPGQF
ncbi:hypothetical protein NliqN6_2070 [Naganishia liquefaciens]|uniref:Uncharacterized protein n=1 Tax=Naganishia liquefaciens TaxID=104408 RepID=A0A8H3TRP7_9TREE|nr:hypothetical protein NliqN6_2070 [Naganishia liquefaciens]